MRRERKFLKVNLALCYFRINKLNIANIFLSAILKPIKSHFPLSIYLTSVISIFPIFMATSNIILLIKAEKQIPVALPTLVLSLFFLVSNGNSNGSLPTQLSFEHLHTHTQKVELINGKNFMHFPAGEQLKLLEWKKMLFVEHDSRQRHGN